jgi:acyl-CoA thioester hydrolase
VERVEVPDRPDEGTVEMPPGAFHDVTEVPIRYKETDAVGIVYFSNHYVYFEIGRTELLRAAGFSFADLKGGGLRLPVARAYCRYLAPARYGDIVSVKTWLSGVSKVRLTFSYELSRCSDRVLVARAFTTHGCLDAASRAARVPEAIAELAHTG